VRKGVSVAEDKKDRVLASKGADSQFLRARQTRDRKKNPLEVALDEKE